MTKIIPEPKSNFTRYKHGLSRTTAYSRWAGMMSRCYKETDLEYKNYGGRGIRVCEDWHNVQIFYNWFSENYLEGMTIDRINTDGNYEESNCRFISCKEQSRNRRNNTFSMEKANSIREMYKTIKSQREISKITGVHYKYVNLILKNKRWAP
jgi:hypothetical protein